jgi:hypothetical protein
MLQLIAESEMAVREAVAAHLAGRPIHRMKGEAVFETRNNRYRMVDGILFEARHLEIVGAEFVGWLLEAPGYGAMDGAFWAGARAVFVHRSADRLIVVTSGAHRFAHRNASPARGSAQASAFPVPAFSLPPMGSPPPQPPATPIHAPQPRFLAAPSIAARTLPPLPRPSLPPRRAPEIRPHRTTPPKGTEGAALGRVALMQSAVTVPALSPSAEPASPPVRLPPPFPPRRRGPVLMPALAPLPTIVVPPYPMAPGRMPEPPRAPRQRAAENTPQV